jgi:hypothetical protein
MLASRQVLTYAVITTESTNELDRRSASKLLDEFAPLLRLRWLQLFVLAALFIFVGLISFQLKFSVIDLDVWWHLKSGDWIVQHSAFPHTGILSRSAANRPWAAYSWGYEVLLSRFYSAFGLIGVGVYGTLLTLMVGFAVFWMLRRLSDRFWAACLLGSLCCYAFLFLMMPRPVFFSIALLCVLLTLLLEAQRTSDARKLYWLPLVFLFWANLHIQFIYGLAVVGLFAGSLIAHSLAFRFGVAPEQVAEPKLPAGRILGVFVACVLATFVGPYSYHLYGVIFAYSQSQVIYSAINELQPLGFRGVENFVELFLAGAAFYAIASQKKLDLFKSTLMVLASVVAFRTMRDSWFLCVAAAACIADGLPAPAKRDDRESGLQLAGVFAGVAIGLTLFAASAEFSTRGLDRAITGMFPVQAVNFVHQNRLPGPLYNTFDWGGFLTWYMPDYPVVIDGRTDLYGEELDRQFIASQNGASSYKDDAYLSESGVVLLRRTDGLTSALELDPRFRKVYEDQISTVFIRR